MRRRMYVGDGLCLALVLSGQTSWLKGQVDDKHYTVGSVGVDPKLDGGMDRGKLSRGDESGFTEIYGNLLIIHRYVGNKDEDDK